MLDIVRCKFPLLGHEPLGFDIGTNLYSALSRLQPKLHQAEDVAISPVAGAVADGKGLQLTGGSHFWLQLPLSEMGVAYKLAGKSIVLGDSRARLGIPRPTAIRPASGLASRLVTVKGKVEAEEVEVHIRTQLHLLNATHPNPEPEADVAAIRIAMLRRRVVRIHGKKIVGFGVGLHRLSDRMSLLVQVYSVAGRRRYGAGFFLTAQEEGAGT